MLEKEAFIYHPEDPFVWSGGYGTNLGTAPVCPPTIYGENRGPAAGNSIIVSLLARLIHERGYGLLVGEGRGRWNEVHVRDLSNVYVRLVEEAVRGGGTATWDADGFYFGETGEFVWRELTLGLGSALVGNRLYLVCLRTSHRLFKPRQRSLD